VGGVCFLFFLWAAGFGFSGLVACWVWSVGCWVAGDNRIHCWLWSGSGLRLLLVGWVGGCVGGGLLWSLVSWGVWGALGFAPAGLLVMCPVLGCWISNCGLGCWLVFLGWDPLAGLCRSWGLLFLVCWWGFLGVCGSLVVLGWGSVARFHWLGLGGRGIHFLVFVCLLCRGGFCALGWLLGLGLSWVGVTRCLAVLAFAGCVGSRLGFCVGVYPLGLGGLGV